MEQENSTGKSNYNSLQASLRVTGWHGITSIANFVWSKSLDNSSDGEDFEPNAAQPQDSNNPQLEYGPSNFDLPKRFTWVFGYEIPKSVGSMQRLKNGWGFNSTLTLQSGQPFQFNYNAEDDFSGGGGGFDRPDVVAPVVQNNGNPYHFINLRPSPFRATSRLRLALLPIAFPGLAHYGNERRDSLRGPDYRQWDCCIFQEHAYYRAHKPATACRHFQHREPPQFRQSLLAGFYCRPVLAERSFCSAGNREVSTGYYQITATGDVGIGNPFLGGGGPRGIQLAAKFTF